MEQQPPHINWESPDKPGKETQPPPSRAPRIYVASLSDYNAGVLHGDWIAADQDVDDLSVLVQQMLRRSTDEAAEEYAIHDFEGFGLYHVNEYDSLDWISRVARGIVEQGPAFSAWAEHSDHDEETLRRFEDAYLGEWGSVEDYAEELLSDLGYLEAVESAVPEMLQAYVSVDVAGFARDLELSGDIATIEQPHGVWIFDGTL